MHDSENIEDANAKEESRDAIGPMIKRRKTAKPDIEILDFAKSPLGAWKQQHLKAIQMIQAFGESLPQFMLQTAAAFLDWTSGTAKQCFPGDSLRGCVRRSVRRSVRLSVSPSVRNLLFRRAESKTANDLCLTEHVETTIDSFPSVLLFRLYP